MKIEPFIGLVDVFPSNVLLVVILYTLVSSTNHLV